MMKAMQFTALLAVSLVFTACGGNNDPVLIGTVSITGTAKVGETLTADTASLNGIGAISYRWFRGEDEIAGATDSTYTVDAADEGKTLTVRVSRAGYAGELTSTPTATVAFQYAVGGIGPAAGWIFYIDTADDFPWTYLECAPADMSSAQWGAYMAAVGGTDTAVGTGQANTAAILAKLSELPETGKAAQLCDTYTAGGYDDWFLPSKDELNLMYTNLKSNGLGGFDAVRYWSSSESDNFDALVQWFSDGYQDGNHKDKTYSVRAVRAF